MNYIQYMNAIGAKADEGSRFEHFRNLVVDVIAEELSSYILETHHKKGNEYLRLIGKGAHTMDMRSFFDGCRKSLDNFRSSPIFRLLRGEGESSKFLFYVQCVFSLSRLKSTDKEKVACRIEEAAMESSFPMAILRDRLDYFIVPSATPEIERIAFEPTLAWLNAYPEAKIPLLRVLRDRVDASKERHVLDDLRLSLELLLKYILKNHKSLEKQNDPLGSYLKQQGCSTEINNMFRELLNYFGKYQNEHVKHNEDINSSEVDFLVILCISFMRLLAQYA